MKDYIDGLDLIYEDCDTVVVTAGESLIKGDLFKMKESKKACLCERGAGGLDKGTEENSRWYYVYIIKRSWWWLFLATIVNFFFRKEVMDKNTSTLLSKDFEKPNIPSGYQKSRRLGSILNDSSGNIRAFNNPKCLKNIEHFSVRQKGKTEEL